MTSVTPRIDHRRHIASLDGLRGLAICLVFLHHYYPRQRYNPISLVASMGWVGVDVFFVLSGFLITGILYGTLRSPHSLRNFFARRSLRLFPLYSVVIGAVVLFAKPLRLPLSWRDVLFFSYGANLSVSFGVVPEFGPFLRFNHLWSLAVEEQFYLLWAPLVFLLASRRRVIAACIVGIVVAILLRAGGVYLLSVDTVYQSLFTRMDAILCGALLAISIRGERGAAWLTERRLHWALGVGMGTIGACFAANHSFYNSHHSTLIAGYAGNDLWCTALLGLALLPGTTVSRWMNHRALRFIGRYSYGLYLLHEIPGPIFDRFVDRSQQLFHPAWLAGSVACGLLFCLCLTVAMACFHAIEEPCLRLKRFFTYRQFAGNAGADASLVGVPDAYLGSSQE